MYSENTVLLGQDDQMNSQSVQSQEIVSSIYPTVPQVQQISPIQGQPQVQMVNGNTNNNISINIEGLSQLASYEQEMLTCNAICCKCAVPHFRSCQVCCGACTAFSGGCGLISGTCCCCYGCGRPSCCNVCCAGCGMLSTSPFIFGIISSCIVGWKMMFY